MPAVVNETKLKARGRNYPTLRVHVYLHLREAPSGLSARATRSALKPPIRRMGGGFTTPNSTPIFHVSPWHEKTGTVLCTVMWLWVFYRAKEDGAWVLGFIHPWDAHHHDGSEHYKFEKEGVGAIPTPASAHGEEDEDEDE